MIQKDNSKPFYIRTEFIACMCAFFFLIIPGIIGIICILLQKKKEAEEAVIFETALKFQKKYVEIGCERYDEVTKKVLDIKSEIEEKKQEINVLKEQIAMQEELLDSKKNQISEKEKNISEAQGQLNDLLQKTEKQKNRISKIRNLYKSITYSIENKSRLETQLENEYMELISTVTLPLHCLDVKSLRKAFKENDKHVSKLTEQYSKRYTTKANKSIYSLMTIALRSELQNILYSLKYDKLETAIENIKSMTGKYLAIAGNGNQSIAGTLTSFIGELEYLFIEAAKIEYNYYVKKEQAKQEQLAIREQMRQEAEERKALAKEKKKIEQEEEKYKQEIEKLNTLIAEAGADESEKLRARILELESQLSSVVLKKEEISNLQNGKAGNVYIISNLGSFGENVFKIGMTRRINPQDRINELGSASVPFKFDVHSFIFSNDAVSLENELHHVLNNKRVNKVNMRKEFFYSSIDELEQIVLKIDPTAEFKKTMLAEEFRQSQNNIIYDTSIEDIVSESD